MLAVESGDRSDREAFGYGDNGGIDRAQRQIRILVDELTDPLQILGRRINDGVRSFGYVS